MSRTLTAMFITALGFCLSGVVFAQDVSPDQPDVRMMPERQQERQGQPTRTPEAAELNEAYLLALTKCLEQSGEEQERCIAETKERFGRM